MSILLCNRRYENYPLGLCLRPNRNQGLEQGSANDQAELTAVYRIQLLAISTILVLGEQPAVVGVLSGLRHPEPRHFYGILAGFRFGTR